MVIDDVPAISPHGQRPASLLVALPARLPRFVRFFMTRRFATFLVFGGAAAVVNLMVGRALYTMPVFADLMPYWFAIGVASAAGLLVNFGLNYAFNFGYRGRSAGAQLRTFVIVALGGVALTALIASGVRGLAGWLSLPPSLAIAHLSLSVDFLAHVFAVGVVMFYSFIGHSLLSFNAGLRAFVLRLPALAPLQRRFS